LKKKEKLKKLSKKGSKKKGQSDTNSELAFKERLTSEQRNSQTDNQSELIKSIEMIDQEKLKSFCVQQSWSPTKN
jgi:hypothetical protein